MIACTADYPDEDRNLFLIPQGGGQPITLTEFTGSWPGPLSPTWSRDGQTIVIETLDPHRIYRVDLKL